MSRMHVVRGALLVGATAVIYACTSDADVLGPGLINPLFANYVAIGNSITAGFQSDGINDSTQRQSYAFLVAKQMKTRYAYGSLKMPGCAPPLNNFQTQTRVTLAGSPASTPTTCALRDTLLITSVLNNVAVPGVKSADPTASVGPSQNVLTELILGGKTQIAKALDAQPTFATVWIGNNDVLAAAIGGQPAAATPQATFVTNYAGIIRQLLAGAPNLKGVLIGVVQVTNAPVLVAGQAFLNQSFQLAVSAAAGKAVTVDAASCTGTTSLIGFPIVTAIKAGTHPPTIFCSKTGTPVGDAFVLDAAEQVQTKAIIDGYNAYIKAKADSIGFGYYDPNVTLARLTTTDVVLQTHVPNLASPTATFGQFVSLDGIHPTAATHIQIANDLIGVINAKYSTKLATIAP